MEIYIKSFYRPYLLDRCIFSIYKNVTGVDKIIILDDGTPEKYLEKIKSKYPEVIIKKSPYYSEKIKLIEDHLSEKKRYKNNRIPMSFWVENISKSPFEYVLLTEDDCWFTKTFNIFHLVNEMKNYEIDLLKLGYNGSRFKLADNKKLTKDISYHNPKLIIPSSKFYNLLLNNSYGIATLLEKYKIIDKKWERQLPLMYNIPMALYHKDYLIFLLQDKFNRVSENLQLKNAVKWHLANRNRINKFSFLNDEIMMTTLFSSASFNNHLHFDFVKFNHTLNEFWLKGEFNSQENLPNDFSENFLQETFTKCKIDFNEWKNWKLKFISSFGKD